MSDKTQIHTAMTIAGSDSGGGAGLQADIKTFAANGVYGSTVITAVTAQNTLGVHQVMDLPLDIIEAQIVANLSDIGADAVKTGMLSSPEIIKCVAENLAKYKNEKLVVDPVMVAKGGASLISEPAIEVLKETLIPMSTIVTPNAPEAGVLTGIDVLDLDSAREAAAALIKMGAGAAVVKGGHFDGGPATDVFYDGQEFRTFTTRRIVTENTHGTGCTFASAIAAGVAKGESLREAVSNAKVYVTGAIKSDFDIGGGHGPLNHFHEYWNL